MNLKGFKPVPEFPNYLVSESGEIFSIKSNRLIKSYRHHSGYINVAFTENKETKWFLLHRVLARVYLTLPSLYSELEVHHIDENKSNYALSNLEVLTVEEHRSKTNASKGYTAVSERCCSICKAKISFKNKSKICVPCSTVTLTEEQIVNSLKEFKSWVKAAKHFNLSDNGLRKAYKRASGGKDPSALTKEIRRLG